MGELRYTECSIQWVSVHSGNESADELAGKQSSMKLTGTEPHCGLSLPVRPTNSDFKERQANRNRNHQRFKYTF